MMELDNGSRPVRILNSGIVVGNIYGNNYPASFVSITDRNPTLLKVPAGWLPIKAGMPFTDEPYFSILSGGIKAVASNGAAVGYRYTSETQKSPKLYYWSNTVVMPAEVALPSDINFDKGNYYQIIGVNSKGEIIANWIAASGENRSYYYSGPDAVPVRLTDVQGSEATKYITLAGINDNGDIVVLFDGGYSSPVKTCAIISCKS
jgi:hypothetical protein